MLWSHLLQLALFYAYIFAEKVQLRHEELQSGENKLPISKFTKTTNAPALADDEKHIPIRQPVVTCCGSPLEFTFESIPVLPTISHRSKTKKSSCSLPTGTFTDSTSSSAKTTTSSRSIRKRKEIEDKCITSVVDPQTVYVTRTSTVYSTTIRTVKNILRETSFTTTTKTSTVKFTSTVLSISAQTKFSDVLVTLPTFVLVTRYKYYDITYTSTQTIGTYVVTYTEQETIYRNDATTSYVTTTVTDCELSIFLRSTTVQDISTITFTNPTVTTVSNGFATSIFTSVLTFTVTTKTIVTVGITSVNFLIPATTIISISTVATIDVAPKIGATYLTVFVVDPNPATLLAVSSTHSVTIQ